MSFPMFESIGAHGSHPKSGLCIRTIETHTETVTAIRWLPDNSGFMSAGLDRKILIWVGTVSCVSDTRNL